VDSAAPTNLTVNANYQYTWHCALGAQYRAAEDWRFSGGFAHDSSAVSDQDRTVTAPMGRAYRIGIGAEWQASESVNPGAAYEFLRAGDTPVTQDSIWRGRISGGFENTRFSFLTLNLTWRF
jgi:long-chain fatty acid transport protein